MQACSIGSVACVALLCGACGGGTPAPKEADEAPAAAKSEKAEDSTAAAEPAPAPGPAASEPSAPAPSPAPSKGSTDLTASSDDVWMASHQMPPKDVMKTMRPQQAKVHACFSAGLKRDPSTSGEVKVKFVVTNDGAVRAWKDDGSSMTDPDVTKCVGDLVQKLKFPKQKSPGDAWATYTANYSR